jgi:hypothetical protein
MSSPYYGIGAIVVAGLDPATSGEGDRKTAAFLPVASMDVSPIVTPICIWPQRLLNRDFLPVSGNPSGYVSPIVPGMSPGQSA